MVGPCLASFPNSRIKSRPPTLTADTGIFIVPPSNGVNTPPGLIVPANAARTYLTIRNTTGVNWRYGYVNRNTLWQDGFLLLPNDAAQIDAQGDVYAITEGAAPALGCYDEGSG
jgi:hypothetical protein